MIIETSANELYRVREIADPAFAHCWLGVPVKRLAGRFVPKAKARERLVRKAASRLIAAEPLTTAK